MITFGPPPDSGIPLKWSASTAYGATAVQHAQPQRFSRFANTWRTIINFFVPVGFEDETGFHFGEKSAPPSCLDWAS